MLTWYVSIEGRGSIENLKLVRSLGWRFLTRLKANRRINVHRSGLKAVAEAGLCGGDGTVVWLKGFGEVKVFRIRATDGTSEYGATSLEKMSGPEREKAGKSAWRIEMYHRALKQQCLIERAQKCRRLASREQSHRALYQSVCAAGESLYVVTLKLAKALDFARYNSLFVTRLSCSRIF